MYKLTPMNCTLIGKWISSTYRIQSRLLSEELKPFGLSSGDIPFFIEIYKQEGMLHKEISLKLCVDKTTTTKVLKKLDKLTYIKKKQQDSDKRSYAIHLTKKGKMTAEKIFPILEEIDAILMGSFMPEDLMQFKTTINKMEQNLHRYYKEHS